MRTRLRLGAAGAVALGALLLATVLASPALAWHSTVEAEASCLPDGSVLVEFTVTPFEDGHDATVDVFYVLNDDEPVGLVSDGDLSKAVSGEFDLPPGTTGTLTVVALVHWEKTDEKTKNKVHVDLPKCEEETTTSTAPPTTAPPTTAPPTTAPPTTAPPTTAPPTTAPETSVSPSTSLETTTTAAAVGGATSTTSGGQLPFTGAGSSGPMLLAGSLLVGGGALVLLVSRIRDRHAA
jgi:CBS domain-containing protein